MAYIIGVVIWIRESFTLKTEGKIHHNGWEFKCFPSFPRSYYLYAYISIFLPSVSSKTYRAPLGLLHYFALFWYAECLWFYPFPFFLSSYYRCKDEIILLETINCIRFNTDNLSSNALLSNWKSSGKLFGTNAVIIYFDKHIFHFLQVKRILCIFFNYYKYFSGISFGTVSNI